MTTSPNGCQHCGLEAHRHFRRWTKTAGWHTWAAPTEQQIKDRMLARREARATK